MDIKELEALLARLDERTDGDYLARLSNGVCIASECADFLREHGPELLRIYRAWQGAAVMPITRQVNPLPARPPLEWDHPSFVTTYARLLECDEAGNLLPDDGQGA